MESNASIGAEIDEFRKKIEVIPARPQLCDLPQHPILPHFRPSCSSANNRYGHSESNGLIGIEFGEFRYKLKNWEKCINPSFWRSLGAIWIDSVSFQLAPSTWILGPGTQGPRSGQGRGVAPNFSNRPCRPGPGPVLRTSAV